MCHCHGGIRPMPAQDTPALAQWLDLPSALFTLHPGWDVSRTVLLSGGGGDGRNWMDCELAKTRITPVYLRVSAGITWQLCQPGEKNREERCHLDLPCQQWPLEAPSGALACFPGRVAVEAWSCCGLHWHLCFQKCLCPRLHSDSWAQIRKKRRPVRAGPPVGRKAPGCGSWQGLACR